MPDENSGQQSTGTRVAADNTPPPKLDRLTQLNTVVTILTGITTVLLGVAGVWAKMRLDQIDENLKKISLRERTEDASYRFAKEFLDRIDGIASETQKATGDDDASASWGTPGKVSQMKLAALQVIAAASSDKEGTSSRDMRAALPLKLALLRGDAGSVASLDSQLQFVDAWMDVARFDDDDLPRTTAIRALCSIARVSAPHDPARAAKCVVYADELRRLLQEERKRRAETRLEEWGNAESTVAQSRARRARLEAFNQMLMLRNFLLDDLKWAAEGENVTPPGGADISPTTGRAVRLLGLVFADLLESKKQLASTHDSATQTVIKAPAVPEPSPARNQNSGTPAPQPNPVPRPVSEPSQTQQTVATLALADSLQAREERRADQSADAPANQGINALVGQLTDSEADKRRSARANLALNGQAAVKPLLAAVAATKGRNSEADYRTRLGAAIALSLMRQPIKMDGEDAANIRLLLESGDRDTRVAAADFLMDLWDSPSILAAFNELKNIVEAALQNAGDGTSASGGSPVYNAAVIVGTWSRNLNDSIKAPDSTTRMSQLAFETARDWQQKLRAANPTQWAQTIATLEDLIKRAEASRRSAAGLNPPATTR